MNLSDVTIDMLKGNQRDLAEITGIDVYIKLVRRYGGDNIYIAKEDKLLSSIRDEEIYQHFNGSNYSELAKKHSLAVRTVYEILERERAKRAYTQLSILDNAENL